MLLGWRDTSASDGLWVQQLLPAVEASNLKNDLIIWPPVVLIHNSSIAHSDPDKRVIVSIEGLKAILRGKFYNLIFDGLVEKLCSKHVQSSLVSSCKLLKCVYRANAYGVVLHFLF